MEAEQVMRWYFAGEKTEAWWILAAGVACLGGAALAWFGTREPFARGLAPALLVMAVLGISVGGTVALRSDAQAQRLVELQRTDAAAFQAEEGPRIARVVTSFATYRVGYAVAALLALALVFVLGGRAFQHGLAVGLLLLAALGFTIDFFAERRAVEYMHGLEAAGALRPE